MEDTATPIKHEQNRSDPVEKDGTIARPTLSEAVVQLTLSNGSSMSMCIDGMQLHCEEVLNFEMRSDDVTVISFPKSGTTWVQEIVWLLCNDVDLEAANATSLFQRYGLLDMPDAPAFDVFRGMQSLKSWPTSERRFIKTHLPFQVQPLDQQMHARGKIIYVVRNPKDTCVSFYHIHRMMSALPDPGTWSNFLDHFMRGQVGYGSWFDHVTKYFQVHKERSDCMHVVSYESLQKDPKGEVRKMADFLEKDPSEEQIDDIVKHCSFDAMSKNDKTNWSEYHEHGVMDFNISKFMRKGKVGDWKNYFTVSQNEAFDKLMEQRFNDCDLNIVYEMD